MAGEPPAWNDGHVSEPDTAEVEPREDDDARAEEDGLRFDDPYWDDAFCAWWDPALRTCC